MPLYLSNDCEDIEISMTPVNLKGITFSVSQKCHTRPMIQTNNSCVIVNGYKLYEDSVYELKVDDIVTVDSTPYCVRMFNSAKKFKPDTSKKITSFFDVKASTSSQQAANTPFTSIEGSWEEFKDHLVFTPDADNCSTKIAAFDLDGTLIKPKSGKKYPESLDDWAILYHNIPNTILEYFNKHYKLIIFSNQAPLGSDPSKRKEFKQKIENILNTIKLPMHVFLATQKNVMRKPCIGMWEALCERNSGKIDKSNSFYVGDAAGRAKRGTTPKDHSFADLFFAKNIGIHFQTPEEFFLDAKHVDISIPYEPKVLSNVQTQYSLSKQPEVIIMVGSPASGKTSFCRKHLIPNDYVHVNRDNLGSWQKCILMTKNALRDYKKVVVDNTNKDRDSRSRFIEVAKSFNVPCRCFYLKVDKSRAMHNNKFRQLTKESHVPVTDIIIHSHYKGFQEPALEEGFQQIVELACVPEFEPSEHKSKQLYEMYLLEKP